MRHRYLVSYDVSDAKRLRKVHKTLRGYGDALHYSVFLCDLTAQEKVLMLADVTRVFHSKEDRFFVVNLGLARTDANDRIEFFGRRPEDLPIDGAVIV